MAVQPDVIKVVRGMDHVGLTVPDLGIATTFLIEVLGAEVIQDIVSDTTGPLRGPVAEDQLGIPNESEITKIRLLRIGDAPGIELFEFRRTSQQQPVMINDLG